MASGALFMLTTSQIAATIPAQPLNSRNNVLHIAIMGCIRFSALDLVDGYYLLVGRASDIMLICGQHPNRYFLGVYFMLQGLPNAPAIFNRLVTKLFRTH